MITGPTAAPGLFERDEELERLQRAILAAVGGAGAVVAVEGEAGIGKTSLLLGAARMAGDAGMRLLRARGGELERQFAYGLVRQLFEVPLAAAPAGDRERWLAGAARLASPVLSPGAPVQAGGPDPSSILHGLYWLVANLAVDQPLLVAVDDAHWADDASIAFLSYLARRVDELAVLLVYTARSGEGAVAALPAVAEPEIESVVLRPAALSRAASAELVRQMLAGPASELFAADCHAATSGNPFLLRELVRAIESDNVTPDDVHADRVGKIVPQTIARATLARLRRLGPHAHDLAFAIAVLGTSAALRHAAALAELEPADAAKAADALTAARILAEQRPLQFIHPIVRTTIYNEIPAGRRAADHKRAARLLAHDGLDDVALAPHLLASEPSADPWIAERLRAAAREVMNRGAPQAACTYLERALDEPPPPIERHALLVELGAAETVVLRPTGLERLREAVNGAPDAEAQFAAAYHLAWALAYAGHVNDAVEVGRQVLDEVPIEDRERRLVFEGWLAATAQFAPSHAMVELERLRRYEGALTGATAGERLVLACLAFRAAHRGETASTAIGLARLALDDGRLLHDLQLGTTNCYFAVWTLIYADQLDEAEQHFERLIDEGRHTGRRAAAETAIASRCQVLIRQGRFADAETEALNNTLHTSHAIAQAINLAALIETMIERSDLSEWEPFLVEHRLDGDLSSRPMGGLLLLARAQMRLASGNAQAALTDCEQLRRRDELSGLDTAGMPSRAIGALAYLKLGEIDAARALATEELTRAKHWGTPSALAIALRAAAVVNDTSIEQLRESVTAARSSQAVHQRALSLVELGAALRRAGHRREARDPLREALDLADAGGARRLAARAREELLATGARPRRTALRGRDALTPSERRVAQLAATGLTNRNIAQTLFITVNTVEGHLTQTYTKLGITSREQLSATLAAPP